MAKCLLILADDVCEFYNSLDHCEACVTSQPQALAHYAEQHAKEYPSCLSDHCEYNHQCKTCVSNNDQQFPQTIQTKNYGSFSLSHIEKGWDAVYLGNELITHGTQIRMYGHDDVDVSYVALVPEFMRIDENDDRIRGFDANGNEEDMYEDILKREEIVINGGYIIGDAESSSKCDM